MKKNLINFLIILGFGISQVYAQSVELPKQENCVAWKTSKRLFLVKNQDPVGVNCKIQTKIDKTKEGFVFEGNFPIQSFDSGEPARDEHIRELLEEKTQNSLVFISDAISSDEWTKKKATSFDLSGILKKGNKDYRITFQVTKQVVDGIPLWKGLSKTKFTALGMEPPNVAGGLVAKVRDELELHFQFIESKIKGFPSN